MPAVYATEQQLAEWSGQAAPDNATVLLRAASRLVDSALLTAVYATDDDGAPTDTKVAAALRDATCAQAATWAALGIDPTAGPAGQSAPLVRSKKIGSASVDYDTSAAASVTVQQSRADAVTQLTGEAVQYLAAAGLLNNRVWVYG